MPRVICRGIVRRLSQSKRKTRRGRSCGCRYAESWMSELEIALVGDVTINVGAGGARGRHLRSPQARVAFALLVLERRYGVTRDALANAMWPDSLPDTWSSALRSVISRVRAFVVEALGQDDDLLVARGGVYLLRLPADTVVDVELAESEIAAARDALDQHRFEVALRSATEATRRLQGPFLTDHDSEWVTLQRERLGDLLVTGLEVVSRAASALGEGPVGLNAALEAIRLAPLRESAHRCLMAAHAAAGNRAQALRAYQRLRRVLAEELGVDPDAETEAAYLQLLGAPPLPPPHPDSRRGLLEPGTAAPFVGRRPELAAAAAVWARAADATQVVLLSGEAGVGKTRLAVEFGRRGRGRRCAGDVRSLRPGGGHPVPALRRGAGWVRRCNPVRRAARPERGCPVRAGHCVPVVRRDLGDEAPPGSLRAVRRSHRTGHQRRPGPSTAHRARRPPVGGRGHVVAAALPAAPRDQHAADGHRDRAQRLASQPPAERDDPVAQP